MNADFNTKNQVNMVPPRETNKAPMNGSKGMKIYDLSDKEFLIILLKEFSDLQENT